MARPAFWKGYLKLSLVTCPVAMTPATTESEKVRFHTINRKTGRRVRARYVDSVTGDQVDDGDEVKGYETDEGQFVTFEDEELEAVALESVRTIEIEQFVPAGSIPWVFYDSPYYLTPTDKVGREAYAVIREAMIAKSVVGVSRVVLFRRERTVMLQPRDAGILLWTLRYGNEVRDPDSYFEGIQTEKSDTKLLTMVSELIEERASEWTPAIVKDPVQADLKSLIARKKKGSGKRKPKAEKDEDGPGASNVIDLMGALKKSLEKSKKATSR